MKKKQKLLSESQNEEVPKKHARGQQQKGKVSEKSHMTKQLSDPDVYATAWQLWQQAQQEVTTLMRPGELLVRRRVAFPWRQMASPWQRQVLRCLLHTVAPYSDDDTD